MTPFVSELPKSGWIDSASLYQVVDYFDHQFKLPIKYPWSIRTVVDLTILFMLTDYQQLAPSTANTSMVEDDQAVLTNHLLKQGLVKPILFSQSQRDIGRKSSLLWASSIPGLRALRLATYELLHDSTNFDPWINWVIDSGTLVAHTSTHGSLIDDHSKEVVGLALRKTPKEMTELCERASSESFVRSIKVGVRTPDDDEVIAGYMCSSLVRGRAHAHMASYQSIQLTPHPFREGIFVEPLETGELTIPTHLQVSNTVERLAQYVVAIAAQRTTTHGRLIAWVETIAAVRSGLATSSKSMLAEQATSGGLDRAIQNLLTISGVHFGSRSLTASLDVLYGVGVGALVSAFVQYIDAGKYVGHSLEIGLVAGIATTFTRHSLAERSSEKITQLTQANLLASGAGIVRRSWSAEGRLK